MADETLIEWAHCTGSPWLVCSKVSCGCTNCYACGLANTRHEPLIRRAYKAAGFSDFAVRAVWGDGAPRVKTKGFWKDAIRLNKRAAREGRRLRMFPSLIDWLDEMPAGIVDQDGTRLDPAAVLADFLQLIHDTPHLDWLLLTKRPENWMARMLAAFDCLADADAKGWLESWLAAAATGPLAGVAPSNVWIGTSVENQKAADERIPALRNIPATIRFLSCEPLLGPVDLMQWLPIEFRRKQERFDGPWEDLGYFRQEPHELDEPCGIHWVIAGGESGTGARPMHPDWARSLRNQCTAANVSYFFKQWGEWIDCFKAPENRSHDTCAVTIDGAKCSVFAMPPRAVQLARVGKKAAGRQLDGQEWSQFPTAIA